MELDISSQNDTRLFIERLRYFREHSDEIEIQFDEYDKIRRCRANLGGNEGIHVDFLLF